MKKSALFMSILLLLSMFSCSNVKNETETKPETVSTDVTNGEETEIICMVDWTNFIRYNGKSYVNGFGKEFSLSDEKSETSSER